MRNQWLTLVILAAAVAIGCWIGLRLPTSSSPSVQKPGFPTQTVAGIGALDVDSGTLNFGTVWLQPSLHWNVKVTNPTNEQIRIARIVPECGCTEIALDPWTNVILPGESLPVGLTFDLLPLLEQKRKQAAPYQNVELMAAFHLQGSEIQVPFRLTGRLKFPLQLDPMAVDFGEVYLNSGSLPSIDVLVRAPRSVQKWKARCDASAVCARFTSSKAPPNEAILRVGLTKDLVEGPFRFVVKIEAEKARIPSMPLVVRGTAVSHIYSLPRNVAFGPVRVGEHASETISLQATGGRAVHILSASCDIADVSIDRTFSDPSKFGIPSIKVNLAPKHLGEISGTLVINCRTSDGAQSISSVPLRATVTAADEPNRANPWKVAP